MVNSWPDGVRPARRRWPGEEDPDPGAGYTPVGLEGWQPEAPAAGIGFNVHPPDPEPFEEFARSWLVRPVTAGEGHGSPQLAQYAPDQWRDPPGYEQPPERKAEELPPWRRLGPTGTDASLEEQKADQEAQLAFAPVAPSSANSNGFVSPGFVLRSTAITAPKGITTGLRLASSGVAAGAGAIGAAAPILLSPSNTQAEEIDLGGGYRIRTAPGQRSAEVQQSDNGILGLGLGRSWETKPINAEVAIKPDGSRDIVVDWSRFESLLGRESTAEAQRRVSAALGRKAPPLLQSVDSPSENGTQQLEDWSTGLRPADGVASIGQSNPQLPADRTNEQADWDRATRRILTEFPDLIQRSIGHWGAHGVELTEAEREHDDLCDAINKRRGTPPPNGQYSSEDAVDTAVGVKIPPHVGEPAAGRDTLPSDPRHKRGLAGEYEMITRVYNTRPTEHVIIFGNGPGVHGPDGATISDKFRRMMFFDSKYSTDPRSVGWSSACTKGDWPLCEEHLQEAVDDKRIPQDVAAEALKNYHGGNFSICTVGTGNAHNGYVIHHRDGKPVMLRRIK